MKYEHIVKGQFLERPNRFVARVRIEDREETVHVKNTGRCRELLQRDAVVYLEKCGGAKDRTGGRAAAGRVTAYDLVAVEKGDRLINMDSQAPNRAVGEWLRRGGFLSSLDLVRPEVRYGSSRFDFYIEGCGERIFMEEKVICETIAQQGSGGGHLEILQNFADTVLRGGELIAPGEEGIRGLTISNAAYLSSWKDDWVSLPLDEEEFLGFLEKKRDEETVASRKEQRESMSEGYSERWSVRW